MANRAAAVRDLTAKLDSETGTNVTVDKETLRAALTPTQGVVDKLYAWLVPGLIVLTGLALVGLFYLIADGSDNTSPDLLLTAFTALLTGLLGLFIRSPQAG